MRIVLVEKYNPSYIDQNGTSVWTNKYGDIIKRVDKDGRHVRPLRAIWTPEMAQDLMAMQGFDAVAELEALLVNQITQEIDRAIMSDMIHMGTTHNFDGETNTLNIN